MRRNIRGFSTASRASAVCCGRSPQRRRPTSTRPEQPTSSRCWRRGGGGWFAKGGPGAVAESLAAAAREAGVTIRTSVDVARIDVADERATGVTAASGDVFQARAVVSAVDPKRTLLGLIDPLHLA